MQAYCADAVAENSRYRDADGRSAASTSNAWCICAVVLSRKNLEMYALIQEHVPEQGDRPDPAGVPLSQRPGTVLAFCDANVVFDTSERGGDTGAATRITLPAGLPGNRQCLTA